MPDKVPPGPNPEDAIEDIFGGDEEEPQKKQGEGRGDSLKDAKERFDKIRNRLKGEKEGEGEEEGEGAEGKPAGKGEGKEGLPEEGSAPEGTGAGVSEGAPKGAGATEGGAASTPGAEAAEAAGAGVGEAGTETGAGGAETAGIVGTAGVAGAEAAEAPAAETAAGAASAAGAAGAATGAAAEAGTTGAAGAAGTAAGAETGPAAPIIGGAVAAGVAAAGAASEVGEKVGISKKAQIFLCCTCCIVFLAGPLLMGIAGFMLLSNRNNNQGTTPAGSACGVQIVENAKSQLHKPYVWGDPADWTNPLFKPPVGAPSYDCSGLAGWAVYWASNMVVNLPHHAVEQYGQSNTHPSKNQLQAGDLIFFSDSGIGGIHHVGIFIGKDTTEDGNKVDDAFIHAPGANNSQPYVRINSLSTRSDFVGATRFKCQ